MAEAIFKRSSWGKFPVTFRLWKHDTEDNTDTLLETYEEEVWPGETVYHHFDRPEVYFGDEYCGYRPWQVADDTAHLTDSQDLDTITWDADMLGATVKMRDIHADDSEPHAYVDIKYERLRDGDYITFNDTINRWFVWDRNDQFLMMNTQHIGDGYFHTGVETGTNNDYFQGSCWTKIETYETGMDPKWTNFIVTRATDSDWYDGASKTPTVVTTKNVKLVSPSANEIYQKDFKVSNDRRMSVWGGITVASGVGWTRSSHQVSAPGGTKIWKPYCFAGDTFGYDSGGYLDSMKSVYLSGKFNLDYSKFKWDYTNKCWIPSEFKDLLKTTTDRE